MSKNLTVSLDNGVILKPDRDKHLRRKHPWVFMGAIAVWPKFTPGDILAVFSDDHTFLGYGYFNPGQSIAGRMVSFTDEDPLVTIRTSIQSAVALRKTVVPAQTTAYRLINGEGDNLPGLVVDLYNNIAVVQINTLGMELLKPLILEELDKAGLVKFVYEKSDTATRKKEGLPPSASWLIGGDSGPVIIEEHGLKFEVTVATGQKTGWFLDQREMRQLVHAYAKDKNVLNCFSYSGGFSVYALAGGAKSVASVDVSAQAIDGAKRNFELNGFNVQGNDFVVSDVSNYLKATDKEYDFIILDPPAFAKQASDVKNASRGYREINRLTMQKLQVGGLLLTSSCSAHIDRALFQTIIFQAAKDSGRNVKILDYHHLAADHPINLFYPEGDYLKSLLLYIE